MEPMFYKEFSVKELLKHNAFQNWKSFSAGDEAKIEYDEKINAVLVKVEDKVIGELPDDESKELVKFLIMGHDVFSGRITRKKDDGNYNDMIKVAIYIKGREAMNIKEGSDK